MSSAAIITIYHSAKSSIGNKPHGYTYKDRNSVPICGDIALVDDLYKSRDCYNDHVIATTLCSNVIATTLCRLREHSPCAIGWEKLLKHLGKTSGDDEPLPYSVIVESNGLDDALWCCRVEPQYGRIWRLFAVWCARQVQHLITDEWSINALDVAEKHANGLATDAELAAARAAWVSAGAPAGAWNAEAAAREVAGAVMNEVAWVSAKEAALASAKARGWEFADVSPSARTWVVAWGAAEAAQRRELLRIVA